jgi:hypothetical protein
MRGKRITKKKLEKMPMGRKEQQKERLIRMVTSVCCVFQLLSPHILVKNF